MLFWKTLSPLCTVLQLLYLPAMHLRQLNFEIGIKFNFMFSLLPKIKPTSKNEIIRLVNVIPCAMYSFSSSKTFVQNVHVCRSVSYASNY